ncbi:MAG: LemA family protein [Candidatus Kaiserbacteria bacterium]|nr:LemA family protein [Candidatus Kaiserbacteria bacterium]MCB9815889.1 LemA family protein [Candidatus Nomurabacteria bacterium]
MSAMWILLIVIAVVAIWAIAAYNKFIKLIQRTKEAWADIDVQLKRRYDLIPNLVETVKGYASHERETLDNVTQARAQATQTHIDPSNITPEQIAAMAGAESALSGALSRLLAVAENYPDLKANTNFLELQRELSDTENKIQAARRFYNGNVRDLNIAIQSFPSNVIAGMFSFKSEEFFELEEGSEEKEPVKVSF